MLIARKPRFRKWRCKNNNLVAPRLNPSRTFLASPVRTTRPLNIAHRGASGHAPENTMAAFRLAVEQGADWIELDIHQTADGHLVVLHDLTLERTAGDPPPVKTLTLKQIKEFDVDRKSVV